MNNKNMNLVLLAALAAVMMVLAGCQTAPSQNNGNENEGEGRSCTADVMECPDGSFVSRDPDNGCSFGACPEALILCTGEMQQCADGSYVGRDANNNCEFKACESGIVKNAPIRMYSGYSRTECAAMMFLCVEGSKNFFDDSGCGCEVESPKNYVANSTEQCQLVRYMCVAGTKPFSDQYGCGCEFDFGYAGMGDGKKQAIDCTDPRPTACTKEYMPVCGQKDNGIRCITEPCDSIDMVTYGNKCTACADKDVLSYVEGACEDDSAAGGAAGTVLAGTNEDHCIDMGGSWTGFDCEGLTQNQCQEIGGTFIECASACRNDPDAEVCTLQCVQVCEFEQ